MGEQVMGVEKQAVYRRIRQNRAYNQERLEVLFGILYRNPQQSLEKWQRMVAKAGFEKTFKKQRAKASYLGKLQGMSFLGLHKSDDRMKAEHANSEFHKIARGWYGSVLEEEEVNRKEKQETTEEHNEKMVVEARERIESQLQEIRKNDEQDGDEQQC